MSNPYRDAGDVPGKAAGRAETTGEASERIARDHGRQP